MSFTRFSFILFASVFILYSCKKDSFITSSQALLGVSSDTLTFDTVFTTAGSITKSLKIFNPNNQKLRLSKVKLMGGATSAYKINIDGISATEVNDVEIAANDSLYVFVEVNINPNANNLPFIIRDSILINYNGNNKFVQLQAYGQNANFLRNRKLTGNVVWTNALPFVILGGVTIDTTATLTIQAGTKIYLHADAPFIVDGTLKITGTMTDKVIFTGDRLDPDYKDLPASWPGIYFRGASKNNDLKFVVIKNAYQGLVSQGLSGTATPRLKISQCIIDNVYDAGILGLTTNIQADNCLVSNCGSNILLAYGGDYQFTHCTVASYGNYYVDHKIPVLQVANYVQQGSQILATNLTAVFTNCIFWGEGGIVEDEVVVAKQGSTIFNVTFDHCLYKVVHDPANSTLTTNIKNQIPLFDSINTFKPYYDFHFNNNSLAPAINKGIFTSSLRDLDDRNRANGIPDLGCYER